MVWLVTAPPLPVTLMQAHPGPVAMYSPGCRKSKPEPKFLAQSVVALFVMSSNFGFLLLFATKVPCAFNCKRTGVPLGAGVGSTITVSSGIAEHCAVGVGFGVGVFFPVGVGEGVGVTVGAGPEHIATLTNDNGGGLELVCELPPPPQLMNNAAAIKPNTDDNTSDLRHHIIAH